MVSCDATKVGANLGREQVQYALSIFRDERIQENQSPHLRRVCFNHTADDHAGVTVAYEDHSVREL
jgi:hypothetical protein